MKQAPLRTVAIYRAFSRPQILWGCEREPILVVGILSFALIFAGVSIVTTVVGVLLWMVGFTLLRKVAKSDPQMSKIYARHIKYRNYYPAKSTPFAPSHFSKVK